MPAHACGPGRHTFALYPRLAKCSAPLRHTGTNSAERRRALQHEVAPKEARWGRVVIHQKDGNGGKDITFHKQNAHTSPEAAICTSSPAVLDATPSRAFADATSRHPTSIQSPPRRVAQRRKRKRYSFRHDKSHDRYYFRIPMYRCTLLYKYSTTPSTKCPRVAQRRPAWCGRVVTGRDHIVFLA